MHAWVIEIWDDGLDGWDHYASYATRRMARIRVAKDKRDDMCEPYPWKHYYRIRKYVPEN